MNGGNLKMFDDLRGYGFIRPDDGGSDVFVHAKTFKQIGIIPEIGMRLQVEPWPTRDGRRRAGRLLPARGDGA
ncbi:cold shock domain-containing protein [Bradyrhizobium sp. RP6]|uniref:cold shock domain-containing protein n=1 Tax=Bradyrhizobium sp. RP6 TaxID=2489596 RepID=UPI000F52476C|nr:cold shock domain-containing protein [Bradyrhizobium sp. RP6]RQH15691.1 cold shock domain-containing protein [Bradyrhizobium sp. RP6]